MNRGAAGSGRTLAFGGLVAGGSLALLVATRPWFRVAGEPVVFAGTEVTGGLASALPLALLAGTLLASALRGRGRRVLAGLLAVGAAGTALLGALRPVPSRSAVFAELRRISLSDSYALVPTPWPWVYLLAGLLALAGATTMLLLAGRWPQRADRFRRAPAAGPEADPAAVWAAQDAGLDPTVADAPDPDVRWGPARDTMGPRRPDRGSHSQPPDPSQ